MPRGPDPIEQRNDELHRRIAAMIRRDPALVARARATLDRWLAREPLPAWLEWRTALALLEPEEVAAFLESTTPRARRLRTSSPFTFLARPAPEPAPR